MVDKTFHFTFAKLFIAKRNVEKRVVKAFKIKVCKKI